MPGVWVILAGVCLALALVAFLQYHFHDVQWRRPRETRVLLVGLRKAGKTVLWQQLTSPNPPLPTVTSVAPNTGALIPFHEALTAEEARKLFGTCTVVDYPGHIFAQDELLTEQLPHATAIVFLIDSTDKETFRESANYLFSILASPAWQKRRQPLCVLINKQWMPEAKHKNLIRNDLEREIERARRNFGQGLTDAKVPVKYAWYKRAWYRIGLPYSWMFARPRGRSIKLTKEQNALFRLDTLDCPLCVTVHTDSAESNVREVKGFIQRALLLR